MRRKKCARLRVGAAKSGAPFCGTGSAARTPLWKRDAGWLNLAAILPMMLASMPGLGQSALPPGGATSMEQWRTRTPMDVPLSELVTVETQGERFRLPAGYLDSWLYPMSSEGVIKRDRLAFAFWMPSRRYPENEPSSTPSFRPREPGRDPPGSDEYIVKVGSVLFGASKVPRQITPQKGYMNHLALDGIDAFRFRIRFGLLEFWNIKTPNPFDNYREIEGTQPKVIFRCTRPEHFAPNPSCDGEVHFEDVDLQFWIYFSRDNIETWRNNVTAARDLILSWRKPHE